MAKVAYLKVGPINMGEYPKHLFVNGFHNTLMKIWRERRIMFCWKELFVRNAIGNIRHDEICFALANFRKYVQRDLYIEVQVVELASFDCQATYNPYWRPCQLDPNLEE